MSNTSTAVPTVVLQHIRYVTASARQRADTQSLALSDALVRQLYLHRDYASALPVIEWVIHTRTAQFGPQHPILIANLEMMAESQHMLGNTLLARDYFEQALHICDHSLSREDPVRLVAYNEFGYSTLFSGGDFRRAYRYLREVVTVRHRTLGLTNGETARSIRNFGYAQIVFGRYHAARRYLVLALRIFEHLHPDFELAKAQTLMHIGEASLLLNDLDNARSYHEQSLAIRQRLRPTNDTDIAESHWHLGRVALAAGSLTIAETHLTCARTMHGSAPEPGNLYYLARVHDALGELELARKQPIRALPCLEQSLALWLRMVGEQHPCTAAVIEHLGDLAAMQADAASADGYYQRALSIIDHLFGVDHPNGKRLRLTR
jgi:tetratricopeptide (TPR) repeat protein